MEKSTLERPKVSPTTPHCTRPVDRIRRSVAYTGVKLKYKESMKCLPPSLVPFPSLFCVKAKQNHRMMAFDQCEEENSHLISPFFYLQDTFLKCG